MALGHFWKLDLPIILLKITTVTDHKRSCSLWHSIPIEEKAAKIKQVCIRASK